MGINVMVKRAVSASEAVPVVPKPITNIVEAAGVGATLQLDASKGITKDVNNNVSVWADQSGNGNNFSQGSSINQPVLVLDALGNSAVQCDGRYSGRYMTGVELNAEGKTTIYVLSPSVGATFNLFGYGRGSPFVIYENVSTSYIFLSGAGGYLTPLNTGSLLGTTSYQIDMHLGSGIDITKRHGGAVQTLNTTRYTTTPAHSSIHNLGSSSSGPSNGQVNMYEVVVFDKILNQTEIDKVNTFISNKYGSL